MYSFDNDVQEKHIDFIKTLFNRKTLKKSIMTTPYSVTYYSSFNYFRVELNKILVRGGLADFNRLPEKEQNIINKVFKNFFKYLAEVFEIEIFYEKNSKILTEMDHIEYNDSIIYIKYMLIKEKRKEIKSKSQGIRASYNEQIATTTIDKEQTKTSARANIIHSADAHFAREIVIEFEILCIHDCFCIPIHDINLCLDYMNAYFRREVPKTPKIDFENTEPSLTIVV